MTAAERELILHWIEISQSDAVAAYYARLLVSLEGRQPG